MRLSVEEFAGMNLAMNLLAVSFGAKLSGRFSWARALAAAALGALYALVAWLLPGGQMRTIWGQGLCLVVMTAVATGGKRRIVSPRALGYTLAGTFLSGGVCVALINWFPMGIGFVALGAWVIVASAAVLFSGERARRTGEKRLRVLLITRMGRVELEALVDTGNRLIEPLSALPVMVVEGAALKGVVDESCLSSQGRLPPGFRLVRYEALGGGGTLRCFRPQELRLYRNGAWREGPPVWVAVYPGRLAGDFEALAPSSLSRREMGAAVE